MRFGMARPGSEGRSKLQVSNHPHPGEGEPQRSDTAAGN